MGQIVENFGCTIASILAMVDAQDAAFAAGNLMMVTMIGQQIKAEQNYLAQLYVQYQTLRPVAESELEVILALNPLVDPNSLPAIPSLPPVPPEINLNVA